MRRFVQSQIGSADEARTPPPSVPQMVSGSDRSCPQFQRPQPLFERSLGGLGPFAELDQSGLTAAGLEPLLTEATALLGRVFPDADARSLGATARGRDGAAWTEEAIAKLLSAVEVSRHAALHDPLTGLANRPLILDHLQLALARAGRTSALAAVIFIDLDDFKQINDTLGHAAGDELLVRVAERLGLAVRPADTVGRWGGDEFVVVCEDLEQASDAPAIIERVAAAFELPFDVAAAELHVAASIGVAISGGTDQPATLIAAADTAMYQAKRGHPTRPRRRHEPAVFPAGFTVPKHERLTHRLLEVLASVEVDETPPADQAGLAAQAS